MPTLNIFFLFFKDSGCGSEICSSMIYIPVRHINYGGAHKNIREGEKE
jgi:hypothetical protein